jgi:outer membrane protein assembly factor BamA
MKIPASPIIFVCCLLMPSFAAAAGATPDAAPQSRTASGKAAAPGAHRLLAVKVSGTSRYSEKEILAASGLELGQNAAEGDFQEAAKHLANSGLFTNVEYSFSYSDRGATLDFTLADIDKSKLVGVHFENFVWFKESELRARLAERVPLFKDVVPSGGSVVDHITEALQTLLDEKGLPGRVVSMPESAPGGGLTAVVFRVEDIAIHIQSVTFPGASPEQAAFLAKASQKLIGADYSGAKFTYAAKFDLLPLFLERGFLKAAFGVPEAHVAPRSKETADQVASQPEAEKESHNEVAVDVSLPVEPGQQYAVSQVAWKMQGNSAVTPEEASSLLHLNVGQPADAVRLERDLETLIRLYHSRGYMTVAIKPKPELNDQSSTVRYDINVTEGALYRMGELEILGVDSASKERLRNAWKLREGDTYNADYTKKFVEEAPRFLPSGADYSMSVREELDAKGKNVDVTLHFKMR